jgi:hypothetical protein
MGIDPWAFFLGFVHSYSGWNVFESLLSTVALFLDIRVLITGINEHSILPGWSFPGDGQADS